MITGISHITIAVKDLDRSFNFYYDILEFEWLLMASKKTDCFRIAADPYAEPFYKKMGAIQSRIKPDLFLPHLEMIIA